MSRQTKSFFNQNDNHKRNGQWHGGYPRQPLAPTSNNAIVTSRAPIPASDETKSKLKSFQFSGAPQERASMITAGSSVNMSGGSHPRRTTDNSSSRSAPADIQATETNDDRRKVPLPHANTFPSTPSDKLTLDELLGNIDESKLPNRTEESPEEILGWNPNSSNTATTPGRKRKRAQSSSPGWPSASPPKAGPAILHKTPIIDPAAELWQRYGGNNNVNLLPDINLALQATPRAQETPVKAAGLRRWASAGNDWPSNRSKRQRVSAAKVWQDGSRSTTGQSKVAAMIEKIQEIQENLASQKLSKQRGSKDDPSSSSPLPETGAAFAPVRSPLRKIAIPQPIVAKTMQAQATSDAHALHKPVRQPSRATESRPASRGSQLQLSTTTGTAKAPSAAVDLADLDMDAFDDFDEDEITRETQIVPRPTVTIAPTQSTIPTVMVKIDAADIAAFDDEFDDNEGDDEFGLADIDEQGLLEAEICATQAHHTRASPRSQPSSTKYT